MAIVTILPEALEQFEALPKRIYERVEALILRLEKWPEVSGAKPLRGELAGCYRLRTGAYRIQFRVRPGEKVEGQPPADDRITVEKVGHRDGFYE
ncbi:MAG TPA: type II toxin-antitoxin system RelE/ParE family toxin [Pirellulales bacterium]|nr:type II toxin-antitoxin system RelE/ParE family toxin [Pirellulales bacterium]